MWIEQAKKLYERAVYTGDDDALTRAERELDEVEAALSLARGRILHVSFLKDQRADPRELPLLERATRLYRALGDTRGEGEALFWEGCFHQVVRNDADTALPLFARSRELATKAGDDVTLSEVLRHLGTAAHAAGRLDEARENLTESCRLRAQLGLLAGIASNQIGLIYIAIAQGRHDDALTLAQEARTLAESAGATRILAHVEEAAAQIPR